MKLKRRRNLLITLLVLGLAGLLGWSTWPRERWLMNIAKPIMSTAEFRPRGQYIQVPYFWLSDHEVGYFLNDAADAHRTFTIRDLKTGQTKRGFTASVDQLPFGEEGKLSPDNRWMLWIHRWNSSKILPTVYAVDGSCVIAFPASRDNELTWMPDSQRLATVIWNQLEQRDLASRNVHWVSLPGAQQPDLLGFTPQEHALVAARSATFYRDFAGARLPGSIPSNIPVLYMTEYALEPTPKPIRIFPVRVPTDADLDHVSLSPQGDRLLWSLELYQASPFLELLRHLRPSYRPPLYPVISWRVSRLDGSDMHEIGRAVISHNSGGYSGLKWVPDGKHVSFIHSKTLYTIPVD